MTTTIDPATLDRIKAELVPLISAYLDEHPELAAQCASVAEALPAAAAPEPAVDTAPTTEESSPPDVDLGALDSLLDDLQEVMETAIPEALDDSSDAELGIEAVDEDDEEEDDEDDEDEAPALDEKTLHALLRGELAAEDEARLGDGSIDLIVEYKD